MVEIKELVEEKTGINDLAVKDRSEKVSYSKFVYYALCNKHSNLKKTETSKIINQFNSSHNAINKFNTYINQPFFKKYKDIYEELDFLLDIPKQKHFKSDIQDILNTTENNDIKTEQLFKLFTK